LEAEVNTNDKHGNEFKILALAVARGLAQDPDELDIDRLTERAGELAGKFGQHVGGYSIAEVAVACLMLDLHGLTEGTRIITDDTFTGLAMLRVAAMGSLMAKLQSLGNMQVVMTPVGDRKQSN
jgi:hypothetical protein